MRLLLRCTAVAGAFLLAHPPVHADTVNPLYAAPPDTQTNPMAESSASGKKGDPGHAAESDASAGKGQEKTAPAKPTGPVRWSAPELNSQRERTAPEGSGTGNDGAEAAVWPHMRQTATHKREAVAPAGSSGGQPPAAGATADKGIQHLHKEGIVHRDLAARSANGGDNATDEENARTDEARERASQDARQAAQPPIMPPPMIDVPKDGMR